MNDPLANLQQHSKGLFAGLLGIRIVDAAPERVVAELDVRDDLCTTPGIMHGGAIMAFADTLGGMGTSLNLPAGAGTTTIESKTNFFAPGIAGTTVRGECNALHRGRRTMVWQTRVTGADGRMLALITQTQMVLEAKKTAEESLTDAFAGLSVVESKALLARLERTGAAMYRRWAKDEPDANAREALLAAALREEENAATLE